MLPPYYFYWLRIDNKHMTEPWLDEALMDSVYRSGTSSYNSICFQLFVFVLFSFEIVYADKNVRKRKDEKIM